MAVHFSPAMRRMVFALHNALVQISSMLLLAGLIMVAVWPPVWLHRRYQASANQLAETVARHQGRAPERLDQPIGRPAQIRVALLALATTAYALWIYGNLFAIVRALVLRD